MVLWEELPGRHDIGHVRQEFACGQVLTRGTWQ
jgi:hypothetical protein